MNKKYVLILLIVLLIIPSFIYAEKNDTNSNITSPIVFTDGIYISSPYGYRIHPITNKEAFHSGIDIAAPIGTHVHSMADGIVIYAKPNGLSGNEIKIQHGKGAYTRYMHMDKRCVNMGDIVKKGQVIGTVGNTGRSTGPHLHFELIIDGKTINGMGVLKR